MSGSFTLTLDTAAPALTWGSVEGAQAGQQLQVGFSTNEPVEIEATVVSGETSLDMTQGTGRLFVDLPPTFPDGPATVTAIARDEVWNEATFEIQVTIEGALPEPPSHAPLVQGPGGAHREVQLPEVHSWPPSRVRARTSYTVRRRAPLTPSRSRVLSGPDRSRAVLTSRTALRSRSSYALTHSGAWPKGRLGLRSSAEVLRRDGPEDEAVLLDLI